MALYRLDPTTVGSIPDFPRAEHPSRRGRRMSGFPGIFPRLRYPRTQLGIYLWQSPPALQVVASHEDLALFESADLHIAGGTEFTCQDTDWPYAILVGAGYTMIPVGG